MTEYQVCFEDSGAECCAEGACGTQSRLMEMTFYAQKEVLFEKIKQKIEEKEGKRLEKIAELLVEAANSKWKHIQEMENKRNEFREKLKEAFEE